MWGVIFVQRYLLSCVLRFLGWSVFGQSLEFHAASLMFESFFDRCLMELLGFLFWNVRGRLSQAHRSFSCLQHRFLPCPLTNPWEFFFVRVLPPS